MRILGMFPPIGAYIEQTCKQRRHDEKTFNYLYDAITALIPVEVSKGGSAGSSKRAFTVVSKPASSSVALYDPLKSIPYLRLSG